LVTVNPEHLAATIKQSPEAFAVSLCAAMRMLCAMTCGQTASSAAAAAGHHAAGSAASDMYTVPAEVATALPPEVLLTTVDVVVNKGMKALSPSLESRLPVAVFSSSSRSRSQSIKLEDQQHVPFVISLLLTALKCAGALRSACPKAALDVAVSVARHRLDISQGDARKALLQQQAASMSAAELLSACLELSADELRVRMQYVATTAGIPSASSFATASDSELRPLLPRLDEHLLRQIVTWLPPAHAADQDVLPTGRPIGRQADCPIIAAGPLVTFRPGARFTGSSSNSSCHGVNTFNNSSRTSSGAL
jgi:hypothetical protein